MPNANERKIIERIVNDSALEMNTHELEELLDLELNKPAEEMDAQLVQELLEVLQPGEVPQAQKKEVWQNVSRVFLSEHRRKNAHPLLRRFVAVAAIVVLLLGLTLGAASAFRWAFLWKWLEPVAETFGIYRNYSAKESVNMVAAHQYTIEDAESVQELYYDLSMIPDTFMGYAIKPGWIPEGYEFLQASIYSAADIRRYAISYRRGNEEMNISVSFYLDQEAVLSHQHEQTVETPYEHMMASVKITFYRNSQDVLQGVSWINGDAHYYTSGNLSISEIEKIVKSYSEQSE